MARASLRATLMAVYVSPEALYRMEWGVGPVDEHGRRMLGPEELAHALSFALFDTGPFDGGRGKGRWIGEALEQGELATKADVSEVQRCLDACSEFSNPRTESIQ